MRVNDRMEEWVRKRRGGERRGDETNVPHSTGHSLPWQTNSNHSTPHHNPLLPWASDSPSQFPNDIVTNLIWTEIYSSLLGGIARAMNLKNGSIHSEIMSPGHGVLAFSIRGADMFVVHLPASTAYFCRHLDSAKQFLPRAVQMVNDEAGAPRGRRIKISKTRMCGWGDYSTCLSTRLLVSLYLRVGDVCAGGRGKWCACIRACLSDSAGRLEKGGWVSEKERKEIKQNKE